MWIRDRQIPEDCWPISLTNWPSSSLPRLFSFLYLHIGIHANLYTHTPPTHTNITRVEWQQEKCVKGLAFRKPSRERNTEKKRQRKRHRWKDSHVERQQRVTRDIQTATCRGCLQTISERNIPIRMRKATAQADPFFLIHLNEMASKQASHHKCHSLVLYLVLWFLVRMVTSVTHESYRGQISSIVSESPL